jgi:hypothetical protein
LKLNLPHENAGAGGGGLGLRHMAGSLQRDGESCVSQGIGGSESNESQGGGDGLIELAGIAQGANETVVRFSDCLDIFWIGGDGGAKGLCRFSGIAGSEQVKATLGERFGAGSVGRGHG